MTDWVIVVMADRIKKNDHVEVITGDHKGSRGKVMQVDRQSDMVLIEGVNMVYRHVRPTQKNPQGGRVHKEAPLHISNVQPYDSGAGKGKRVRFEVEVDKAGHVKTKRRVTTSGTVLHTLTRAERSS